VAAYFSQQTTAEFIFPLVRRWLHRLAIIEKITFNAFAKSHARVILSGMTNRVCDAIKFGIDDFWKFMLPKKETATVSPGKEEHYE
jgi:hypothetical protein